MAITEPVTVPSAPAIRTSVFAMRSVVAISRSPFTLQEQVQEHQGQIWAGEMTLPPVKNATIVGQWRAFFGQLNGRQRRFLFSDPDYKALIGAGGGTPLVDGAQAARTATLDVKGLPNTTTGVWLPGDYIQLGTGTSSRLHMVLASVDSDGGGLASVEIWPSTRDAVIDNAAIVAGPTAEGIFRQASNQVSWEGDASSIIGFSFPIVEALS